MLGLYSGLSLMTQQRSSEMLNSRFRMKEKYCHISFHLHTLEQTEREEQKESWSVFKNLEMFGIYQATGTVQDIVDMK